MIATLAAFYVNYLEPGLILLSLLFVGLMLYQIIMLIIDGKRKSEFANILFKMMISAIKGVVVGLGKITLWLVKTLYIYIKLIFASITDFFSSRI